jgi:hypothetical protein
MLSAEKLSFTKKQVAGADSKSSAMVHANECFCCRLTEGPVLECSFCPNVFHLNCLPKGTKISRPRWGCPSHRCAACGAQTSTSRGKIYRCITCPSAYCFDHAPNGTKTVKLNPYEALGYTTKSFVFVQCGECMKDKTIQTDLFTETPLELELRFKSKSSAGTGSAASHRKRSNSFSDDDEYEIEYPRKKQRTSPVASPVESVVASTRRKVKTEGTESNGHIQNTKRTYDAFQPDHKTYMQPQRQAYQAQQYVDAPQVPLVPNYYSGGNDYSFFRPAFGVMYYQPQADNNYSSTQNGYQHHAYNTPSTVSHYSNGHTAQNNGAHYPHSNGTTRPQQNGTSTQYDNMVKIQMPEFHSVPNVTAHSNQYFTNITSLNNPMPTSTPTNGYSQQQAAYGDYAQNQNNSTIDIYNIN